MFGLSFRTSEENKTINNETSTESDEFNKFRTKDCKKNVLKKEKRSDNK